MQWVRLLHQGSSRKKGYWMNLKKIYIYKAEAGMATAKSSAGSRPRFGVATSRAQGARDKGQTGLGRDTVWRRDVTEIGLSRLDVAT